LVTGIDRRDGDGFGGQGRGREMKNFYKPKFLKNIP
jgi:hypothetical protein